MLVVLDEALVGGVEAVVGAVGEDAVELLELLVDVVDAAAERLAPDPADLHLLQLQELLRRLEGIGQN